MWLALVTLSGCDSPGSIAMLDAVRQEAIDAHLRFLTADQLEGRAPGTLGSSLAAQYIAAQFATAGLEPAVADTSYHQRFRLLAARPRSRLALRARGGAALVPRPGVDYSAWATTPTDSAKARGDLIFAGYGITAPELEWDDYKGADVTGDVLLILAGEPSAGERFRGDTLTRYGQPEYKLSEAWRRGASAAFIVEASPQAALLRERPRFARATERLYLPQSEPGAARIAGWLTRESAEQIAGIGGLDFTTLLMSAEADRFRPVASDVTVAVSVRNEISERRVANVAALLRGADPAQSSEFVLFTAHYDALGVGPAVSGDSIYNGAYDNASGVALLLTLAEAFGSRERRLPRSMLFLATTASEGGRLGSRYYVSRPLQPLERTVAVLNLDGVNLWGPTREVALADARATDLYSYAGRAAAAEDLRLRREILPAAGTAFASDQITFLRAGVPAALIEHGIEYVGRMPGWGERMLADFLAERLHSPSDEYEAALDLDGAVQQGRFVARLGELLASAGGRPALLEGRALSDTAP